jgi:hypothetical protein
MSTPPRNHPPALSTSLQARRQTLRAAGESLLLLLPLAALAPRQVRADALWLVTDAEARTLRANLDEPLLAMRQAGAPKIDVVRPQLADAPLRTPMRIELAFVPAPDAAIVPASFRANYGAFKLDITDRLLKEARVSAQGLTVERAAIPPGAHRLVLQVADSLGRVGRLDLRFAVA